MANFFFSARRLFGQPAINPRDRVFLILTLLCILFLIIAPAWLSPYALISLRDALVFGLFALSYDLLWGKARILTLGHGAFFGLGAYGLAITNVTYGFGTGIGILVGVAGAAVLAAVVGYFLIFANVRLHFFAIITIAVLLIVGQVANSWSTLTGGDVGILGIPGARFSIFGHVVDLTGEVSSYWFVVCVLSCALFAVWAMCRGNYGKILSAVGMNEFRAKALGYNTSRDILAVFVLSAALAGMSGAIFAATMGVVAPDLFSPLLSTQVILWTAVGGRGTLLGPVFAAVLFTRLQQEISSFSTNLWPFIAGLLFLGLILFAPEGLPGIVAHLRGFCSRKAGDPELSHE